MQSVLLMQKPHLQFFPLAIAASIYILNSDRQSLGRSVNFRGLICLWISSVLLCGLVLYLGSPWLAHLAAIVLVGVWSFAARPQLTLLRILGICGLMLVTLPPPFGWDKQIVSALQAFSSFACSRLMDLTQIVHVRRGNVIEVISKNLFVEEACSGVDSQYALMAVAGVLLLFGRAGFWVTILTIITVPIWAILGNLLRIYLIVVGLEWFGVDLSTGIVHSILGLLVFVFTAWVHWSSVQLLNYLQLVWFPGGAERSDLAPSDSTGRWGDGTGKQLRYAWYAVPLSLLVFFPESVRAVIDFHARPDLPSISIKDSSLFPGEDDLIPEDGIRMVRFHTVYRDRDDMLGQHSRIWELQSDVGRMSVCLDFPFRGWHPLWECYMNSGWNRMRSELIDSEAGGYFETILENDLGDIAVLHFSLIDEDGNPYSYEGSLEFRKQARRWTNTIFSRKRPGDRYEDPMTIQFQQIAYTSTLPSQQQLDLLRRRFLGNRSQIILRCEGALLSLKGLGADVIK